MSFMDFFKGDTDKSNLDLSDFKFESDSHIRYEKGVVVGRQDNCNRGIRIQSKGTNRYDVTIYNQDGNHPLWGDNIQMSSKQMKIIEDSQKKITLVGFGTDSMGASFADYGVSLHLDNGHITKCVLLLHDRKVEIEYLQTKLQESSLTSSLEKERELINVVANAKIVAEVEKTFGTTVNSYGCAHKSEFEFVNYGGFDYVQRFSWCNWFIIPVEYDYKVVMPKTYYKDIESFSPISEWGFRGYISKLKNYEELKQFMEKFTTGATVIMTNILTDPVNDDPEKIIPNSQDRQGAGYAVLCYFID